MLQIFRSNVVEKTVILNLIIFKKKIFFLISLTNGCETIFIPVLYFRFTSVVFINETHECWIHESTQETSEFENKKKNN